MDTSELQPRERAAHYRQLAAEQLELAERARLSATDGEHRELAAMWTRLAEEAERAAPPSVQA